MSRKPASQALKDAVARGLLGYVIGDRSEFVGACCLTDDDAVVNVGNAFTTIWSSDAWFVSEICVRCGNLVERPKKNEQTKEGTCE